MHEATQTNEFDVALFADAVAGMLAASSSAEERSGGESHSGRAARPIFETPEQEEVRNKVF